jgi:radical SAM superfamily enzyme YgiQ (UPF0313 family)
MKGKRGILKKEVDFKNLPFPCFRDLPLDAYTMPFSGERMALVVPSRGCTFNCSFCLVPVYYGRRVKFREPKYIVDELVRNVNEYKIKSFLFWTETFTMKKKFVLEICNEIIARKLDIRWMAPARVDTVDEEMLRVMKQSGCFMLSFGVESLEQEILDKVNKNVKVFDIEKAIELCKDVDINVMAHIIVGLPGQTKKSVKKTIDKLIDFGTDYIQVYCAVPYPKTGLHQIASEKGWIESENMSKYEINTAVMRNEHMSAEEIQELRNWCYRRFYFRPKIIIKQFLENPSPRLFLDGVNFFLGWVRK